MANMPPPSSPAQVLEVEETKKDRSLIQRWHALTALPEAPRGASFEMRDAVRKSRLTSSVLFFFTVMVIGLLPACYISPYPSYFWLTLGLAVACIIGLILNRQGLTKTAGSFVTLAAFTALTAALFSTVPFDETTLQGYDMYIIVELLAVSLLPARNVFIFLALSIAAILVTLFTMQHSHTLDTDLQTRIVIILARPIGTLFLGSGVAFILASHLTRAIKRVEQAEEIARLEHELVKRSDALQQDIQQILATHVAVANGDYNARAPLSQDNVLWQIARSLNTLLVRHQRAVQAEYQLREINQATADYIATIQRAKRQQKLPLLPLRKTQIDPLVVELQGVTVGVNDPNVPGVPRKSPVPPRPEYRNWQGQKEGW